MTEEKTKLVLWGPPLAGKTTMVEVLIKSGRAPMFSFRDVPQFQIPMREKKSLNQQKISESLQKKFKKNEIFLPKEAIIEVLKPDEEWKIMKEEYYTQDDHRFCVEWGLAKEEEYKRDDQRYFVEWLIKKEENILTVYGHPADKLRRRRPAGSWGDILEVEFSPDRRPYVLQWTPGSPFAVEKILPHLLKDAKGILFLVDLAKRDFGRNLEYWKQLEENLPQFAGHSLSSFPVVVCYNKLDCPPECSSVEYFEYIHKRSNPHNFPWIFTMGIMGVNVKAAFLKLIELVTYWEKHESLPKEACSGEGTVPRSFSWKPTGKDYEEEDRYSWDPPEYEEEVEVEVVEEDEEEPEKENPKDPPSEAGIEDMFG